MRTEYPIGQYVTVLGGFENGCEGVVVGYGVGSHGFATFDVDFGDGQPVGGFELGRLEPQFVDRCPYCGPGACRGSARTANGRDVERFHLHHPRTRQPRLRAPQEA